MGLLKNAINRRINWLDEATGKRLFGNTIGLKRNVIGRLELRTQNKITTNSNARRLIKDQFLLLEEAIDPTLIQKIKSHYDRLLKDQSQIYSPSDYLTYLRHPELKIPEIKNVLSTKIREIVYNYFGKNFTVKNVDCFRYYHVPDEIAIKTEYFSYHWHCDRRNVSELKMFVGLHDITDLHGATYIQTKERTKFLMKKGFKFRNDYNLPDNMIENPDFIRRGIGKAGTVYFANTVLCLHKAGIPTKGHFRDMLLFVFVPSDIELPDNWDENVIDTLEKYITNTKGKV